MRLLLRIACLGALAAAAAATWLAHPGVPTDPRALALGLALAALAAASAALASPRREGGGARLALTFVLAAAERLPPTLALGVGVAALAAGRGGGVSGPRRRGAEAFVCALPALAGAVLAMDPLRDAFPPSLFFDGARLAIAFGIAQIGALGLHAALHLWLEGRFLPPSGRGFRLAILELATVPLAGALSFLLATGRDSSAAALAFSVVCVQAFVRKLDRTLTDLRDTNDHLAARLAEVASLHAVGREMLSSLNPARVLAVVERECRKMLDVDDLHVALVDPETGTLRIEHRWNAGASTCALSGDPVDDLTTSVFLEKRPLRIPCPPAPSSGASPDAVEGSLLAVPLVVEERVIGVVAVRAAARAAYGAHQQEILEAIAQQAAVALENARRYEMATVDSLTRLLDRDYFQRCLEAEHNRARRYGGVFAILMLDLDSFKNINDTHGHLAGDRYLRALGAAIRSRLRGADLACRCGGDEFCILLPETDLDGALAIAERIRRAVARLAVDSEGTVLRTTASIGISVYPEHDGTELRTLLVRADQALYRAKREGRDRILVYAE